MRVLCYAQALSGVGHDVRMRAIARGLADAHEVHVVAGGRALPHAREGAALRTVTLPAVARVGGALVSLDPTVDVRAVLAERARGLVRAVEHIRPDALLIDHYPFSKWELEGATNLVADDRNDTSDVFIRDRKTGATLLADVNRKGEHANRGTSVARPAISGDGVLIAFVSVASNLAGPDNGTTNVFLTTSPFLEALMTAPSMAQDTRAPSVGNATPISMSVTSAAPSTSITACSDSP